MFLAAIEGTEPLSGRDRVPVPPPPASPVRKEILPATVSLTVEGDGQRYAARAPGVNRSQLADLRAGKVHAEETLDLHGETIEVGVRKLQEFLVRVSRTRRCVLVVHGKGLHSDIREPTWGRSAPLREAVLSQLLGECSGFVHALASAAPVDGGEGATYILLRGHK